MTLIRSRAAVLGLSAALILSAAVALPLAASATGSNIYVNTTGSDATGDGSSAHPYATIQHAIDESSTGDTIHVAAGTYTAGFTVSGKSDLTIVGAGAASTVVAPATLVDTHTGHKYTADMQVSAFVNNSSDIVLKNLEITDNGSAPGAGGPDALLFWNDSNGSANGVAIHGGYAINGDQTGQGIAVDGNAATALTVTNSSIDGFQKNGIDAEDGNDNTTGPGTLSVTLQNSQITGAGATGIIAQNGVVAWNEGGGAVAITVKGSSFADLDYTGADTAAGILAYGGALVNPVVNTSFTDTQIYIGSGSSGTPITATSGNTFDGVTPGSATGAELGAIEDKLSGAMESAGADPIFILPKTYIATPNNLGIQTGLNLAANGYTVIATPGTYSGDVTPPSSNNVTLEGLGGPVINLGSGYGINLDNNATTTNFTFEGFTVNSSSGTSYAFKAYKANGLTLSDDTFNGAGGGTHDGGVDLNTISNVTLTDVTASGFYKNGFALTDAYKSTDPASKNITFDGITSSNNGWAGIAFYTTGNAGGSKSVKGITFSGANTISNNGEQGIFIEGDTDANYGSLALPANKVTTDGTTLELGTTAFSGNGEDIVNYQTAPVDALSATFNGLTGNQMSSGQITAEDALIFDQLDDSALGLVTYHNAAPPATLAITAPVNDGDSVSGTYDFTADYENGTTSLAWAIRMDTDYCNFDGSNDYAGNADSGQQGASSTPATGLTGPNFSSTIDTSAWPDGQYCFVVNDLNGQRVERIFTLDNAPATPSVTTDAASGITDTDATLNGTDGPVDADNTSFWWGTTPAGPFTPGTDPGSTELPGGWSHDSGLGAASASADFSEDFTNLAPDTTYYFVAWVEVGGTWYPGDVESFMTASAPVACPAGTYESAAPIETVSVDSSQSASTASANDLASGQDYILASSGTWQNGSINAADTAYASTDGWSTYMQGYDIDPYFLGSGEFQLQVDGSFVNWGSYSPTHNYSYLYAGADAPVSLGVFDGDSNTNTENPSWYGDNSGSLSVGIYGCDVPSVTTDAASGIDTADATMNATDGPVDADNTSFWWGTSAPTGSFTPGTDPAGQGQLPAGWSHDSGLGAASASGGFSEDLSSLPSGTTYYFLAWVEVGGTWYPASNVLTFTTATPGAPSVTTDPAQNVSESDATLEGTNGPVIADESSFWVSTSTIDTSSPTIPEGVYSTQVLGPVGAGTDFSAALSSLTAPNGAVVHGQVNGTMPAITASTTYYYVAWVDVAGTWYPGNEEQFTTGPGPVVSSNDVVVQEADLAPDFGTAASTGDWFFENDQANTLDNTLGSFVDGPDTAPLGDGSAEISIANSGQGTILGTFGLAGIALADVKTLSYSTYRSAGDPAPALALQFDINTDGTSTPISYEGRLVFEPYLTGATVENDTWQSWDTLSGAGWWFSHADQANASGCSQATPCTLAQVLTAYPNIGVTGIAGFKAGSGWNAFTGDVDDFVIETNDGVNDTTTTYDFEPTADNNDNNNDNTNDDNTPTNNGAISPLFFGTTNTGNNNGQVLGAETSSLADALGYDCSQGPYLTQYMRQGKANDADQVERLQAFLNLDPGASVAVDGTFGPSTTAAVDQLQEENASQILAPWGITTPTGYVYKLTEYYINEAVCPDSAPAPQVP